jgi:hypothetical protein
VRIFDAQYLARRAACEFLNTPAGHLRRYLRPPKALSEGPSHHAGPFKHPAAEILN